MDPVAVRLALATQVFPPYGSEHDLTPAEKLHNLYMESDQAVKKEAARIAAYLVDRAFELAKTGEVDRAEITLNINSPISRKVVKLLEADGFNVKWTWDGDILQLLFKNKGPS